MYNDDVMKKIHEVILLRFIAKNMLLNILLFHFLSTEYLLYVKFVADESLTMFACRTNI